MVKKLVMSARALIGRSPTDSRRCCSQSGLAPLRTPRTVRPSTQGQASVNSSRHWIMLGPVPSIGGGDHGLSVPRPAAARSRAMPRTASASPRLGVTEISITGSSSPVHAA
jgi:hypothetical protein